MAKQTEYEELLEEFVKDRRVRELLGTGAAMTRDARVERRERGLANALLAFSGSKRRVEKPVTEAKRRELTDKEDVILGDVKQQMLDLAKLQQKILTEDLEPEEARKERMTLLGKLMETARGVMTTTATSVASRDRQKVAVALKRFDEAEEAFDEFQYISDKAKGKTDAPATMTAAQAQDYAEGHRHHASRIRDALLRVPERERQAAKEAILADYQLKISGKDGMDDTRAAELVEDKRGEVNALLRHEADFGSGSLSVAGRAYDRLQARRKDAILAGDNLSLQVYDTEGNPLGDPVVPADTEEYKAVYAAAQKQGQVVVETLSDAAAKFYAENFGDPRTMLNKDGTSFLQGISEGLTAVGGATFQRDLNRLLMELSGMPEGSSVPAMLDAILGDEAAAPELAERIQSVEDRRAELLGKVPTRDAPVTPTSVKEELARRGEQFMQEKGTSLSALPDPTQFLRQAYKARRQVSRGREDVNMPFRSGKRFAGMEADLREEAAKAAAKKRRDEADEEVRFREKAAERSPI